MVTISYEFDYGFNCKNACKHVVNNVKDAIQILWFVIPSDSQYSSVQDNTQDDEVVKGSILDQPDEEVSSLALGQFLLSHRFRRYTQLDCLQPLLLKVRQ